MIKDMVLQAMVIEDEDEDWIAVILGRLLTEIEDQVLAIGGNKLHTYGLPEVVRPDSWVGIEHQREEAHTHAGLSTLAEARREKMTPEQLDVYNEFLAVVDNFTLGLHNDRNLMFLGAPGGTGKTFIINSLLYAIRGDGRFALATSSR